MKPEHPIQPNASLIERALESYDFGGLLLPKAPMPAVAPVTPTFAPAPVAAPAQVHAPHPSVAPAAHFSPVPVAVPVQAAAPVQAKPASPVVMPPVQTGVVAEIDTKRLRQEGFIEPGSAPTILSEEFRLAKRQVLLSAFGGRSSPPIPGARCMLTCSAQPNEGKTYCSINLALSMSNERDLEVVLVDADVAKPEVLSTLGIQGGPGLMDAIADPSLDAERLLIRTSLPNLLILPTGSRTHDDTELLASDRTREVIERLLTANPRRIIIIDTAPALAASPASTLAHHVGQIVMVVRADKTGENELREAVELLDGCDHIQLLLNRATYSGANQKLGYYYGYGG